LVGAQGTAQRNIAFGYDALGATPSGVENIAMGTNALVGMTTGSGNVALGNNAGNRTRTGGGNVYLGTLAGFGGSSTGFGTAANNVGIGGSSLSGITSGASNVAIGSSAGSSTTTGNFNIMLGRYAAASTATASNEIVIGTSTQVGPKTIGGNSAYTLVHSSFAATVTASTASTPTTVLSASFTAQPGRAYIVEITGQLAAGALTMYLDVSVGGAQPSNLGFASMIISSSHTNVDCGTLRSRHIPYTGSTGGTVQYLLRAKALGVSRAITNSVLTIHEV